MAVVFPEMLHNIRDLERASSDHYTEEFQSNNDSAERILSTDHGSTASDESRMVVRTTSHRRLPKKSYIDQPDRRPSRDFQMSEINQVALLPPSGKDAFEDYRFQVPYPKCVR
ncbi:hypothetical protein KIN20_005429 [Parelaphostrongylus tenuis]|uniref:Uncharacterized protein n=1 Tax=Parelaphostrongylus tenuis TaxID=148309 RepID=A0AAD5MIU6_PARTN|nr:hypothetical protein KIN20_005429 [Parelaphostrongylus tenuis]